MSRLTPCGVVARPVQLPLPELDTRNETDTNKGDYGL